MSQPDIHYWSWCHDHARKYDMPTNTQVLCTWVDRNLDNSGFVKYIAHWNAITWCMLRFSCLLFLFDPPDSIPWVLMCDLWQHTLLIFYFLCVLTKIFVCLISSEVKLWVDHIHTVSKGLCVFAFSVMFHDMRSFSCWHFFYVAWEQDVNLIIAKQSESRIKYCWKYHSSRHRLNTLYERSVQFSRFDFSSSFNVSWLTKYWRTMYDGFLCFVFMFYVTSRLAHERNVGVRIIRSPIVMK